MLAVVGDGVCARRVDDDRAVMADLLLEPGMAVIPVGAVLDDREFVGEGRLRQDAGEADAGHAVHVKGKDEAVPVDRSEEHTSELQSLMRISYAVFCLKKKKNINKYQKQTS